MNRDKKFKLAGFGFLTVIILLGLIVDSTYGLWSLILLGLLAVFWLSMIVWVILPPRDSKR